MIFFGHIGITSAAIRTVEKKIKTDRLRIDYRFVILGSIFLDIIDKPFGFLFLHGYALSERFFAHTLAFHIIILLIGALNFRLIRRTNILILGISSLIHTILDLMWVFPGKYFYPCYGFRFPLYTIYRKLPHYAVLYFSHSSYFFFEVIGILLLYKSFYKSLTKNGIRSFFKNGELPDQ